MKRQLKKESFRRDHRRIVFEILRSNKQGQWGHYHLGSFRLLFLPKRQRDNVEYNIRKLAAPVQRMLFKIK